jgi:hypothetical protein
MTMGSDTAWFALIVLLSMSLTVLVAIGVGRRIQKKGKEMRESALGCDGI